MFINPTCLSDSGVIRILSVFETYQPDSIRLVGGSVRDAVMGREVNDIDFATVLVPEVVTTICERAGFDVIPTGIEHGTVTVVIDHQPYEITTLRRDVETDGRRAVVAFSTDWAEDAYRRDFTFNALYLGADGRVYDYSPNEGGISDARERQITFMGDAEARIREDYLRILRAFRFQAVLGCMLDQPTKDAIRNCAAGLAGISGERIEKEVIKLLNGPFVDRALRDMVETGVFEAVFGFAGNADAIINRIATLMGTGMFGRVPTLALVMGWDWPATERMLNRWKSASWLRDLVGGIVRAGPIDLTMSDTALLRRAYRAKSLSVLSGQIAMTYAMQWLLDYDRPSEARVVELIAAVRKPQFPLQGRDLIDRGVKPGKLLGDMLRRVEDAWVDADFDNSIIEPLVRRVVNGQ